ncbi:MAG: hypothetical protein ACPGVO_13785 [Spirulinaceae cyanobacterium]
MKNVFQALARGCNGGCFLGFAVSGIVFLRQESRMTLATDHSQTELEFSYEIPDELKAKLTEMHQKRYGELYESAPPDATPLEDDIREVLELLQQNDPQLGHLRLVWMALILVVVVEPTLKYYHPETTIPDQTIAALTCWLSSPTPLSHSEMNLPDLENLDELVAEIGRSTDKEISNLQTLYETISVYQDALNALDSEQASDALLDILEGCLEGNAIFTGSQRRRDLFDWCLQDVYPSSWRLLKNKHIFHLARFSEAAKIISSCRVR